MRKRRSFVATVHRWLFYVSVGVVVGSALSRIDDEPRRSSPRVAVDDSPGSAGTHGAPARRGDERSREATTLAFAACP